MAKSGWKQLQSGWPWFRGDQKYPIAAYSEFMPPPRLGRKPYGTSSFDLFDEGDPWGWNVTEYEEALELQAGMEQIAHQVVTALAHLGEGRPAHGIAKNKLLNNPYWPSVLAEHAGSLRHERYVVLMPLALSRTQDDKGRIRWTLFGCSEQGPGRAFWKSFYLSPEREIPKEQGLQFFRNLLQTVYGEQASGDLSHAGFRILPSTKNSIPFPWAREYLPSWTKPYWLRNNQPMDQVKFLLTFRPFGQLPEPIQQAYLAGRLQLLPFPGSLLVWGVKPYLRLSDDLPLACQVPLLHLVARHENPHGVRVPQSGWLHEPRPEHPHPGDHHGPMRNTYRRSHRWARVHRHEDELAVLAREEKLLHVLFSTAPDDIGLYGKPMARNVQIWGSAWQALLDGPRAQARTIQKAAAAIREGGLFGYRFQFPAMRVGQHEVYWHRPLAAYLSGQTSRPALIPDVPPGYFTAYRAQRPDPDGAIELWPRLQKRKEHLTGLTFLNHSNHEHPLRNVVNVRKLLDTRRLLGDRPLPPLFARQLLTLPKHEGLDAWLSSLPDHSSDRKAAAWLVDHLRAGLEPEPAALPKALTFSRTAKRTFEIDYWKTIGFLAEGQFINKDNADCVLDPATESRLAHHCRDLEALGDYLISYYRRLITKAKMAGKAFVGDMPFSWRTDIDLSWSGGWLRNQKGEAEERNIIVVIPGRDRRRAIIMADHYDTAYMADCYEKESGGSGARLAAAGADDNHSATAALMLGASIFLQLSRTGKLGCDVWLVHLTGEEFPSDCLGARHLCQRVVEENLRIRLPGGRTRALSKVQVQGVYVLDMIAHNNDRDKDVFQIAPGAGLESMWLAYQAHLANEIWNESVPKWNHGPSRLGTHRGRRSPFAGRIPEIALHPRLHGEIRPTYDPRSTLYNTDGQIFSDAGIPVVLFMENYDINRVGYHDTHDTMANIDLDYGAALSAIAIEAVVRAATEEPPSP